MTLNVDINYEILPSYLISGKLATTQAAKLLTKRGNQYLSESQTISRDPVYLRGAFPVYAISGGEHQLLNGAEVMKELLELPGFLVSPDQEIVVFQFEARFDSGQLKALEFIFKAETAQKKATQEKLLLMLIEDKELLSGIRQILGLPIGRGPLKDKDIARLFRVSPSTAHNRRKAV